MSNEIEKDSNKFRKGGDFIESNDPSMIPTGLMPSYLAEAFSELYSEDGLLVLGKGLGLLSLVASFCRFYGDVSEGFASESGLTKPPLVFVLGLREDERTSLISILETWGTPPTLLPTMVTNESGQGKDRARMSMIIQVLVFWH